MKQALPDYIKQHENLRQILMAQEGGIMKYLVTHMDANGTAKLFSDYQNMCVEKFFEANKWDLNVVWAGDEMKRAALGFEHLFKEVQYQRVLKAELADKPTEAYEMIEDFTEQYLTYAYKQDRQRKYPNGMTPAEIYQDIIDQYSINGLVRKCTEIILREHNSNEEKEKTATDIWTEFSIRQWANLYNLGMFAKMRQAVAEMLVGKANEQCRLMAIDMMERVRGFSQKIYTDEVVQHLREKNYIKDADQRENDGKWLRDVADHAVLQEYSAKVKIHSMRYYFADFTTILENIGRIWAAQLLVHGIDMQELEKQVCCILMLSNKSIYYVDKYYSNDTPMDYCIANTEQAEELLDKINNKSYLNKSYKVNKRINKGKIKNNGKPQTLKYYTHGNNGVIVRQRRRVDIIYRKFIEWGWIDDKTTPDDFDSFFEGVPRFCNITWTGNSTILTILLQNLIQQPYIEKQTGCLAKSLVKKQFGKTANFDRKRLDSESNHRIMITLYILNINNPLPEQNRRNEADEFDIQDAALKEILAGQLHSTKRI